MYDNDKSHSTGINTDQIQHSLPTSGSERKNDEEWKKRKANKSLPHELQYIPDLVGKMVESGITTSQILNSALASGKHQNDPDLERYLKNLEKIVDYLITETDKMLSKTAI